MLACSCLFYSLLLRPLCRGGGQGGGGTGIKGAESGVEGAESGVEGREAGVEGAGRGANEGGSLERLEGEIAF